MKEIYSYSRVDTHNQIHICDENDKSIAFIDFDVSDKGCVITNTGISEECTVLYPLEKLFYKLIVFSVEKSFKEIRYKSDVKEKTELVSKFRFEKENDGYYLYRIPDRLSVNSKEYQPLYLLGKGKGGYSYLASDDEGIYVLKQIHHEPCSYYSFGDKIQAEINDYKRLKNIGVPMPNLLDVDIKNERILKEYIDGPTIFELVKEGMMKDIYIKQMKEICVNLYKNNTNIDYYPTNFIVMNDRIYYIDFECNDYHDEWNFENWGIKYWSMTDEFKKVLEEK